MSVAEKSQLLEFLETQTQRSWIDALDALGDAIHEVDRNAVRIWFAFWPLDLNDALSSAPDVKEAARLMDLEGEWKLEEQLDASVAFLYGAHHWAAVKQAVLTHRGANSLRAAIEDVAGAVATAQKADTSLVLGISAVGLMAFRQLGQDVFEKLADSPAAGPLLPKDPARVVANRRRESRDGVLTFLKGVNRRFEVRWNERERSGTIRAINGQDIAMAGAADKGDYRSLDYRRIDGPVPVECRIGNCGYCWVGVVAGKDNLSPITKFERERLRYFGYDVVNSDDDTHPLIRLACQSQCSGDVTLAISPWNGELNRRHNEGPKKLGTS